MDGPLRVCVHVGIKDMGESRTRRWFLQDVGCGKPTDRISRNHGVCLSIFSPFVGALRGATGSRHGSMESCELFRHLLVKIWLVCVYSLGMLMEVGETGELLRAMLSNGKSEYIEHLEWLGQIERRKCPWLVVNDSRRMDGSVSIWDPQYKAARSRTARSREDGHLGRSSGL